MSATTKKIRLLTSVAGTEYTYAAGQIVDAPLEIAEDLLQAGHAVLESQAPSNRAEKAVSPAAKKAETRQA